MAGPFADGGQLFTAPWDFAKLRVLSLLHTETLSGSRTVDEQDPMILKLDPGGAGRTVTLEAEDAAHQGRLHVIVNAADAAEDLTVKDPDTNTIGTVSQNELGVFYNQGTSGWTLICLITIALS